jgi:menaquinone-9 beta-reductase
MAGTAKLIASEKKSEPPIDVLVVGAGAAGAAAAYYIAEAGFKVVVLDGEKLPKQEISGDFVSPGAIKQLEPLGITQQPEFEAANKIETAAIFLEGKKIAESKFPAIDQLPKISRVIPRAVLDKLILGKAKQAGATLLEDFHVTGIEQNSSNLTVTTQSPKGPRVFTARLLIGADGNNSEVAQILRGGSWPKQKRACIIQACYQNVVGDISQADIYYSKESFPGYCWLFPVDKYQANVGVGVILDTSPAIADAKQLLFERVSTDAAMKSRLQNATLNGEPKAYFLNTYDPTFQITANRIMLVGEAAGLTNPFNGEGLQLALCSAKWASETANACLANDNLTEQALSAYSQRIGSELGGGFQISAIMLGLTKNRSLNPLWLNLVQVMADKSKTDPQYASLTGGIISGMIFPNEKIAAEIVVGALEEATIQTGFNAVTEAINNPAQAPQMIIKITETGFQVAKAVAEDPVNFFNWGLSNFAVMGEFAAGMLKQTLKQIENNSNP